MTIELQKQQCRRLLKHHLQTTDTSWLGVANISLLNNLKAFLKNQLPQKNFAILGWIPSFYGEVNLLDLITTSTNFFCPRCLPNGKLEFFKMPSILVMGSMGILEPDASGNEGLNVKNFSRLIVLVPGLGFDLQGSRLGRGKGYYDRFLASTEHLNVLKIGICWAFQCLDFIPTSTHDYSMDYICTEERIVKV